MLSWTLRALLTLVFLGAASIALVYLRDTWACYTAPAVFVFHAYFALTKPREEVLQCIIKDFMLSLVLGVAIAIGQAPSANGGWGIPPSFFIALLMLGAVLLWLVADLLWSAYTYVRQNNGFSIITVMIFMVMCGVASASMNGLSTERHISWEVDVCNGGWTAPLWVLCMVFILIAGRRLGNREKSAVSLLRISEKQRPLVIHALVQLIPAILWVVKTPSLAYAFFAFQTQTAGPVGWVWLKVDSDMIRSGLMWLAACLAYGLVVTTLVRCRAGRVLHALVAAAWMAAGAMATMMMTGL